MVQQPPPIEAVRALLFERAAILIAELQTRLAQAADHITNKEHRAVIGALDGLDTHIQTIRILMQLMNEYFSL